MISAGARSTALKALAGVALAAAVVGGGLWWLERPPAGPVEPAWDREHCAHCHMAVSDPRFAAQIQTAGGEILFFDDPGCLLRYEKEHHPRERAVYFHHSGADRWLTRQQAGFVKAEHTPMDWGLAAVDAKDATDAEEAAHADSK